MQATNWTKRPLCAPPVRTLHSVHMAAHVAPTAKRRSSCAAPRRPAVDPLMTQRNERIVVCRANSVRLVRTAI
jgi:hypothetical protein